VTTPLGDEAARVNRWIALLGRRDEPTDGVEDYCGFLGRALQVRGVALDQVRVTWIENGWIGALRQLWRESRAWRGQWVLLQYTALSWSRRGFSFYALAVLAVLRRFGVRVAVVFHESARYGGTRWTHRFRGVCQGWVMRKLYEGSARSIFTVPIETVAWLPRGDRKAAFIPLGANIPERLSHRAGPSLTDRGRTVIVFGVTGAPEMTGEVDEISAVMKEASEVIEKLRLVVIGRGSLEAREQLGKALEGSKIELIVRGVLPAEEIADEFERADALLFVRGPIRPERGSAIAGIACGVPVVGYRTGAISSPLKDAGVEWSQWHKRDELIRGLVRVLSNPARWTQLHERNLEAQKNWFSWSRTAERYREVLAE
jgi:glycosyltransferase involved in cell wall biosynthesis